MEPTTTQVFDIYTASDLVVKDTAFVYLYNTFRRVYRENASACLDFIRGNMYPDKYTVFITTDDEDFEIKKFFDYLSSNCISSHSAENPNTDNLLTLYVLPPVRDVVITQNPPPRRLINPKFNCGQVCGCCGTTLFYERSGGFGFEEFNIAMAKTDYHSRTLSEYRSHDNALIQSYPSKCCFLLFDNSIELNADNRKKLVQLTPCFSMIITTGYDTVEGLATLTELGLCVGVDNGCSN